MKRIALMPLAALLMGAGEPAAPAKPALSPSEIVAQAPATDWAAIAPADLMVMDLAPLGAKPRRVVIQLMPAPFSRGWVLNIRRLVAARWYDGVSVNRVQDNYVVQWGDVTEKKPLPSDLVVVSGSGYEARFTDIGNSASPMSFDPPFRWGASVYDPYINSHRIEGPPQLGWPGFSIGWPVVAAPTFPSRYTVIREVAGTMWPVHCYGMVGVARNMPPDAGTGAELYTVIGHAPRQLDRNIALVGRVIEGMEHLSSLPRGTGALGFYEKAEERVPILSVRMGNEVAGLPAYQYLSTDSASFAAYADARANRRDAFYIRPAGGADICNIPVPVRRVP
ncbi:MAG: peptidylprolyl isomerase [Sphingomonadales bacterium]|nr:peptidylprolyl isomerase [Sphingomonadales bacterium]